MQALSVNNMKICKLDFANDSMLRGTDTMQNLNSRGDGSRQSGRVHVNADNFKVTAAKEWNNISDITAVGSGIEVADEFVYLHSHVNNHGNCVRDTMVQIDEASDGLKN